MEEPRGEAGWYTRQEGAARGMLTPLAPGPCQPSWPLSPTALLPSLVVPLCSRCVRLLGDSRILH